MINSPQSESSPVPSVTNYPESDNPNWIIGFENDGEKVKTPPTSKNISLTGAISGLGSLGTAINTTFSYPLNAGNNRIVSVGEPVSSQDGATKNYVDTHSGGDPTSPFTITNGSYWTEISAQKTNFRVKGYGTYNSVASGIFETNSGGESGGYYANGDYSSCFSPMDQKGHIFQDEDANLSDVSSIKSYVNTSGSYIVGGNSAIQRKVLKEYKEENLLEKFLKLKVNVSRQHLSIDKKDSEKKKLRKKDKNSKLLLQLDAVDLPNILPFASNIPQYLENIQEDPKLLEDRKRRLKEEKEFHGVDTYHLQLYQILVIQELIKKIRQLEGDKHDSRNRNKRNA